MQENQKATNLNLKDKTFTSTVMNEGFPQLTEKPWGKEILAVVNDKYALKEIHMIKDTRSSLQSHTQKQETIWVLSGKIELELKDDNGTVIKRTFKEGEGYTVPPGLIHRVKVIEDAVLIEVSTPELQDVIRHEDDYGRKDNP